MKRSVLVTLTALSGLLPLGAAPARAQFEIDPDHFESPNVEPFDKVPTDARSDVGKIRYDGKFRLAYTVECNGKSLRPGRYSLSLRYDGKVARATLNQDGQTIGVGGVVHRQVQGQRNDAPGGTKRNNTEAVGNPSSETEFCPRSGTANKQPDVCRAVAARKVAADGGGPRASSPTGTLRLNRQTWPWHSLRNEW